MLFGKPHKRGLTMKRLFSILMVILLLPMSWVNADISSSILGDVDGDSEITAADASIVLRSVVRLATLEPQQRVNADTDMDEAITASDAAAILRFIVRLDSLPPTGVYVSPPPKIPTITFVEPNLTLSIGAQSTLIYTQNVSELPAIAWSSSAPDIASVDSNGTVTTHSIGTALISASVDDGETSICTITVADIEKSLSFVNISLPSAGALITYQNNSYYADGIVNSQRPILQIDCTISDVMTGAVEMRASVSYTAADNQRHLVLGTALSDQLDLSLLTLGPKCIELSATNTLETVTLFFDYFTVSDYSSSLSPNLMACTLIDDTCYSLYSATAPWTEVQAWVLTNGGTLATIASAAENTTIKELIDSYGLTCWLGASRPSSGSWAWVRNESFDYTNWVSSPTNDGQHLAMYGNATDSSEAVVGQWAALENDSELVKGFVVESTLCGISVVQNKTQYVLGEKMNLKRDIAVYARFSNGDAFKLDNYDISDTSMSEIGDKIITISYGGFTQTISVLVNEGMVIEGTQFVDCEHLPLPQNYERLEYQERFNLHGTVFSEDALLSVTMTITHDTSSSGMYPYVRTVTFDAADEVFEYRLEKANTNEKASLNDLIYFEFFRTGNHSYTISATTTESSSPIIIADGTFSIANSGEWKQLTYRKLSHNYEQTLEFFGGDTSKFLFSYKWNEGRYIKADSEWRSANLTTMTGYNGHSWTIHKDAKPYFSDALFYLNNTYVRVRSTNGKDSGVILLGKLVLDQSGPTVIRYQSDLKSISHHALGTAIDINPAMDANTNKMANKAFILTEAGDNLTYNGIKNNGSKMYYDFTYSGSYYNYEKGVPTPCINYLIYELAFYRAGFKWGCYFEHTSDAMHYTLTESDITCHDPENGGLRKVYEYCN